MIPSTKLCCSRKAHSASASEGLIIKGMPKIVSKFCNSKFSDEVDIFFKGSTWMNPGNLSFCYSYSYFKRKPFVFGTTFLNSSSNSNSINVYLFTSA